MDVQRVFAIDPGSRHAGWALVDLQYSDIGRLVDIEVQASGTCKPAEMLEILRLHVSPALHVFIIEGVEVHQRDGKAAAGKHLFETCIWIGQYKERAKDYLKGRVPYYEPKRSTILNSILTGEMFTDGRKTACRRVMKQRYKAMETVTSHAQEAVAAAVWYGIKGGSGAMKKPKVNGKGDEWAKLLYGRGEI